MAETKKVKLGCIGLGPRGAGLYKMATLLNNVELYAVCDQNEETLAKFKHTMEVEKNVQGIQYFNNIEDFLKSDVEAVIVATHVSTHSDISIQCMDAGKHVLCEIPNISSFEEATKLGKAVKAHPELKFMVAENCCFWAFINSWKTMYEEGLLGDVVYAESDYIHPHEGEFDRNPDGSVKMTWRSYLTSIHYLTHNLGPLLYILDDTCDEISGFIPGFNPIEEAHPAPPNGVIMVKTKKGVLIKIFIGFGVHHTCRHNFEMYGSKGSLEYRRRKETQEPGSLGYFKSIPNTKGEVVIPAFDGYPGASEEGHGGADPKMMQAFVDCIINDTKPPLDIEFGINIALPGLIGEESFKNGGKTIKMPSVDDLIK